MSNLTLEIFSFFNRTKFETNNVMIIKNKRGIILEEISLNECDDKLISHSLVIIKNDKGFLLVWDKWKQSWELPGGSREGNESPLMCAVREVYEETNQDIVLIKLNGIMKFIFPDEKVSYGCLYSAKISSLREFNENSEIGKIILWDKDEEIGLIDDIDRKLLDYYDM